MLNLFIFGSCRISRPIKAAMDAVHCKLINRHDPLWVTHTSSAAVQSLDFILRRSEPPMHMRELVFETNNEWQIDFGSSALIDCADLIIVEVCTLNSITLDGFEVNAHRFRSAENNGDVRCKNAERFTHTAESLRSNLKDLQKRTGKPIMVVDHIARTGISKVDRSRGVLTREISKAIEDSSVIFFRTERALDGVDITYALDDHNHYRKEFEPIIGAQMVKHAFSSL